MCTLVLLLNYYLQGLSAYFRSQTKVSSTLIHVQDSTTMHSVNFALLNRNSFSYHFATVESIAKIMKASLNCLTAQLIESKCLQQTNSHDCGLFVLCHADLVCETISSDKPTLSSLKQLDPMKSRVKRKELVDLIKVLKEDQKD